MHPCVFTFFVMADDEIEEAAEACAPAKRGRPLDTVFQHFTVDNFSSTPQKTMLEAKVFKFDEHGTYLIKVSSTGAEETIDSCCVCDVRGGQHRKGGALYVLLSRSQLSPVPPQ